MTGPFHIAVSRRSPEKQKWRISAKPWHKNWLSGEKVSWCNLVLCSELAFIHSIGMCRTRQFLVVLSSFFHSSLLRTFSCHPSPPTILPSSLTSSYHLFLGLPLNLVVPKFVYNTLLGILFSSILCTWYLIRFSTWSWKSTNLSTPTPLLPTSGGSC